MAKSLDLIIFDLDGTLYERQAVIDEAYPQAALTLLTRKSAKNRKEIKQEFFHKKQLLAEKLQGKPTNTITLLYYYDITIDDFEREVNRILDPRPFLTPDPKVQEVVYRVHAHYPVYLFTTNNGRVAHRILETLHLDSYFPPARRYTLSTVKQFDTDQQKRIDYIKPGLKGFQYVLGKEQIPPARALMVGDSKTSDIEPAVKLGLYTYHVTNRKELYQLPEWLNI